MMNSETTVYIGDYYEKTGNTVTKYYDHAGKRIAMRVDGTLYWLLGDKLGSTSVVVSGDGTSIVSKLRYQPWGEVWYQSGASPTDRLFTGQRYYDGDLKLYDYKARWYDPALGRFVQADSIVPEPGNPQALNRYSYGLNNPVRYTDPTGHFSEEGLEKWYGKDWRGLFTEAWIKLLLHGEFGDLLVHGDQSMIFVEQEESLALWDIGMRSVRQVRDITGSWQGNQVGLYRSRNANQSGGPSKIFEEVTDPQHAAFNRSNEYLFVGGNLALPNQQALPLDWYLGPTSYIRVRTYMAGLDIDLLDGAELVGNVVVELWRGAAFSQAARIALGGANLIWLAANIASWTLWDTSYQVAPGTGPLLPQPVPVPGG